MQTVECATDVDMGTNVIWLDSEHNSIAGCDSTGCTEKCEQTLATLSVYYFSTVIFDSWTYVRHLILSAVNVQEITHDDNMLTVKSGINVILV